MLNDVLEEMDVEYASVRNKLFILPRSKFSERHSVGVKMAFSQLADLMR